MPQIISHTELGRLVKVNSDSLRNPISLDGRRMQWIGYDFVDEGPVQGNEAIVVKED